MGSSENFFPCPDEAEYLELCFVRNGKEFALSYPITTNCNAILYHSMAAGKFAAGYENFIGKEFVQI